MATNEEMTGQKRRSRRSLVLIASWIRTEAGLERTRLRNLSCKGALLEADCPPPTGSRVVFERGETIVPAQVAWVSGCRFGIQFDSPIAEEEVLIHIGKPQAKAEPDSGLFKRPGLRPVRLGRLEREAGEAWFNSQGKVLGD